MTPRTRVPAYISLTLVAAILGVVISGCDYIDPNSGPVKTDKEIEAEKRGKVTGPGGIASWFDSKPAAPEGATIGVNAFLWRASLDTISIWPVSSADPYGGVIITDWYSPPATPTERFKLNVYIIDRALRADGLRVAVFRQVRTPDGDWQNAAVQPETQRRLEEAILMRARQLRNETTDGS